MKPEDVVSWIAVGVGIILVLVVIAGKLTEVKVVATFGLGFDRYCYPDGTCNLILYSGVRNVFEDGVWKRVENARDLTPYFRIVYLEHNPNYNISIVELNYTHVNFNITVNGSHTGKKVPIKFCYNWTNPQGKVIPKCKAFQAFMHHPSRKFNFTHSPVFDVPLGYYYVFGLGSTTIMLQDADTENLDDTHWRVDYPTQDAGADDAIRLQEESTPNEGNHGILKFNITAIPSGQQIDSATLYLYYFFEGLDSGEAYNFSSHGVYPYPTYNVSNLEWTEGDNVGGTDDTCSGAEVCGNTAPGTGDYNTTLTDRITVSNGDSYAWKSWGVSDIVSIDYSGDYDNTSIMLLTTIHTGSPGGFDYVEFYSKEDGTTATRPYLNITYSVAPPVDTCTPGATVWNMKCSDNCTKRVADSPINVAGPWNIYGSGGHFLCDGCNLTVQNYTNNATNCKIIFNGTFKYTQG